MLHSEQNADPLLSSDWLRCLVGFKSLMVGLSGGLDSVVLLHCLSQESALQGRLSAVHVHHGLSEHADAWLLHCETVCSAWQVPLMVRRITCNRTANIEADARRARYDAFSELMTEGDAVLVAHHADDQAETVLLQLFRGAGIDGMAGMPVVRPLGAGMLLRPFLTHARIHLEHYARQHQLVWVEDDSNHNVMFSRNYVRHQLMPLLQKRWPGVVGNLVRTAAHCQQAKENLHALALIDEYGVNGGLGEKQQPLSDQTLSLSQLQSLHAARRANVIRTWLMRHSIRLPSTDTFHRLINDLVLAHQDNEAEIAWDGVMVRRYQDRLYLLQGPMLVQRRLCDALLQPLPWSSFPKPLCLSSLYLGSLVAFEAKTGLYVPKGAFVSVAFRKGGETFYWRGQTKSLKKLFQQWRVPPWQRPQTPLIYIDGKLAAIVGYAVSDEHYRENMAYTYLIELH